MFACQQAEFHNRPRLPDAWLNGSPSPSLSLSLRSEMKNSPPSFSDQCHYHVFAADICSQALVTDQVSQGLAEDSRMARRPRPFTAGAVHALDEAFTKSAPPARKIGSVRTRADTALLRLLAGLQSLECCLQTQELQGPSTCRSAP